jgi:hypothetical protein
MSARWRGTASSWSRSRRNGRRSHACHDAADHGAVRRIPVKGKRQACAASLVCSGLAERESANWESNPIYGDANSLGTPLYITGVNPYPSQAVYLHLRCHWG